MELLNTPLDEQRGQQQLFDTIARDLVDKGFSITPNALPPELGQGLWGHATNLENQQFDPAGIGREQDQTLNRFVRSDEICWINGETDIGKRWLEWAQALQAFLNRRLYLGLFSFESHFAHYGAGDFYKRHYDAFRGEANRVLSLVVYLNPGWQPNDGGQLVLYQDDADLEGIRVTPAMGTAVVFLSEDFPHEVLPAQRDRYSIAGWFRVNTSTAARVDPPR